MDNAQQPTRRPRRTQAQWQQLISSFDSQQQTVLEFCQSHQITAGSFYRWRNRLAENAEHPLFIEVQSKTSAQVTPAPAWDLELELGQGMVLRVRQCSM